MQTWKWKVLRAGAFRLDGGTMFGVIPKALWARMTDVDEDNRIPLQTNCVLLQSADRQVLIETGFGNKFGQKDRTIFAMEDRWIGDTLQEEGIDRSEISDVIVTHLHFDHAGGLTYLPTPEASAQSSFPKARIYTQRCEWEDALANRSTMTRTYLRDHLAPVAHQIQRVDGPAEILPGIRVLPVPGHTWGQQAVLFHDDQGPLCFPGDVMPTIHHVGDAFNMSYDMLPYQNTQTKRALLQKAHQEGWRIILDHEAGPAVVHVDQDERGRFVLRPATV
ncbi:MAG: MBL fold metallo-hydrolase [Myxococcales bacterium]|nr:MBL fold metallo-hydrolase [Myxococcales bacterium]MCB9642763.1 MBL fold metallo-hydrolase [Myxococcales bacterium]